MAVASDSMCPPLAAGAATCCTAEKLEVRGALSRGSSSSASGARVSISIRRQACRELRTELTKPMIVTFHSLFSSSGPVAQAH